MYFEDHSPPHFHVEYGEYSAVVSIQTLGIIAGRLPPGVVGMVAEWAGMHQDELSADWDRAVRMEPFGKNDPL